jgi:hypothetical protein
MLWTKALPPDQPAPPPPADRDSSSKTLAVADENWLRIDASGTSGLLLCMKSAIGACASAGSSSKSGHVQSTVVRQTAGIVASLSDLTYEIWSDGACAHKTTGAGGYAAVLVARRSDGITAQQWEVFGGDFETTNNRMELMAVITGLRDLPAPARVCIFIDSTYVKKNFGD